MTTWREGLVEGEQGHASSAARSGVLPALWSSCHAWASSRSAPGDRRRTTAQGGAAGRWAATARARHRLPSACGSARASRGRYAAPCLHQPRRGGSVASLASPPMAAPQGPSCEIRCVIEHHYAAGAKGGSHPVEVRFFGKRGKQVKKLSFVPAAKAHEIARKLQGAKGSTIAVL